MTQEEISANIDMLRQLDLDLVGLSGHDSSDEVIQQFRVAFGSAHRDVRVGEPIVVADPERASAMRVSGLAPWIGAVRRRGRSAVARGRFQSESRC